LSLILNGHMDVVPTGSEARWSGSPERSHPKRKLYGRGSCDMKAGVTANIFAVQALQTLGFSPAADVLVESVIGEESGGVGTLTTIVKGFQADAAIITNRLVCICARCSQEAELSRKSGGPRDSRLHETLRRQRHGEVLSRAAGVQDLERSATSNTAIRSTRFEQYRTR